MPDDRARRHVLRVLGAAGFAAFSGCASIVNRVSDTRGRASDNGTVPRTTSSGTPSAQSVDGEPNSTATTTERTNSTTTAEPWSTESVTIERPAASFASVPTAETDTTYPRMGTEDAGATVTLYGNWKCPYTQNFVVEQLPGIVKEFVKPGDLSVRFRALAYRGGDPFLGPDAPRAARAGLALWDRDPGSFWSYFGYVFGNQPPEERAWAQPDLLVRFAEAAGVRADVTLRSAMASERYAPPVGQTVSAANEVGVWSVPRLVYDGEVVAPTVDPSRGRALLNRAADGKRAADGSEEGGSSTSGDSADGNATER